MHFTLKYYDIIRYNAKKCDLYAVHPLVTELSNYRKVNLMIFQRLYITFIANSNINL